MEKESSLVEQSTTKRLSFKKRLKSTGQILKIIYAPKDLFPIGSFIIGRRFPRSSIKVRLVLKSWIWAVGRAGAVSFWLGVVMMFGRWMFQTIC